MSAKLEQLHYTWTPRGIEGMNRFQIAAMSAGLKRGPMAPLLPVVRKLCRYDSPRGKVTTRPISYGWLDYRSYRIAFCRIGLDPLKGKVGNFAAHVIVGDLRALPEKELALRFGSSFWWSGNRAEDLEDIKDRRDFELPAVDLADIGLGMDDGGGDLAAADRLAHALLTLPTKVKLTVAGDSYALGNGLRTIASCYPEALSGLSVSTYEGAATYPFRVMGTLTYTPNKRSLTLGSDEALDPLSEATLESLRSSDASNAYLRAAAAGIIREGDGDGDSGRQAFWNNARGFVAVSRGLSMDVDLAQLLGTEGGLAYVASQQAGRQRIADAIHSFDAGALKALQTKGNEIELADWEALYDATLSRYKSTKELGGCAKVAHVLGGDGRARAGPLLDAILDIALADASAVETLQAMDVAALIVRAAKRGLSAGEISWLLQRASSHLERLAGDERVPDSYILKIFKLGLNEDEPIAPEASVAVLGTRPHLLSEATLGSEEQQACLELLEALDGRNLEVVLSALLICLAESHKERLGRLLERLSPVAVSRLIVEQARLATQDPPPAVSDMCDAYSATLLRGQLSSNDNSTVDLSRLANALLGCSRSADYPLARDLLNSLGVRSNKSIKAAEAATAIRHPELRSALIAFATDRAVAQARRMDDLDTIWGEMRRQTPDASDAALMRRLLMCAMRSAEPIGYELLLLWMVTRLLPVCDASLWSSGRIREGDIQEMCLALAARIPHWRLEEDPRVLSSDKKIRSWWSSLVERSRKAEAASRRSTKRRLRRPLG